MQRTFQAKTVRNSTLLLSYWTGVFSLARSCVSLRLRHHASRKVPMSHRRKITHGYRIPGGWHKIARHTLTPEYAEELRSLGYTLLRTKRAWRPSSEMSITPYLRTHAR